MWLAMATGAIAQGCGPTNPNCVVPTAPPGTSDNRAASTAFVQNAVVTGGSGVINLQNITGIPVIDVTSGITNMFGASGGGALFSVCPLTYGPGCVIPGKGTAVTYVAQYLKATATQGNNIAEYMVVNDCDLNAGRIGPTPGSFNDNKVCMYNSVVTGSQSGNATWVQANNFEIGATDSVPPGTGLTPFKVNTELDMQNNGPDCAPGVRNCYHLYLSGDYGANRVTSFMSIAATAPAPSHNAYYGILLNGNQLASDADIEVDGSAAAGICLGCLGLPSSHATAAFWDKTNSANGLWLNGTYSTFSIQAPGFNVGPTGYAALQGATFTGGTGPTAVGQVAFGATTVAAGASGCPSGTVGGQTVAGCLQISVGGTIKVLPFF